MNNDHIVPALLKTWTPISMIKIASLLGLDSWSDASAFVMTIGGIVTTFYTILLCIEWFFKRRKNGLS